MNIGDMYYHMVIMLEHEQMDFELKNHKVLYVDNYLHIEVNRNFLVELIYEHESNCNKLKYFNCLSATFTHPQAYTPTRSI